MTGAAWLSIALFFALALALMLGLPVALTLAGVSLLFAGIGIATGTFDPVFLDAFPNRVFGIMGNETLLAVPLFVFMGVMLERSQIAERLLTAMAGLFGSLRGGLAISVMLVGAVLAASTGIVGATVVTMGLIALPTMLRAGYDPRIAAGTICSGLFTPSRWSAISMNVRYQAPTGEPGAGCRFAGSSASPVEPIASLR